VNEFFEILNFVEMNSASSLTDNSTSTTTTTSSTISETKIENGDFSAVQISTNSNANQSPNVKKEHPKDSIKIYSWNVNSIRAWVERIYDRDPSLSDKKVF